MSLLDTFTGGKAGDAEDSLRRALATIQDVKEPTKQELTLPELQRYVQAGIMTPAQAEAVLQKQNAFDQATGSTPAREAEMKALSQMQDVASSGGMNATAKARINEALNAANTNTAGQRASILDQMAQKGIPTSLMGSAAQMAAAGQDAQTANLTANSAASDAEQRALQAMSGAGTLGGNIEGQAFGEQAQKAQAKNAIDAWNAANQTQNNQFNAQNQTNANLVNNTNAQDVANKNTTTANARTQYNTNLPQQIFNNSMEKATGGANIYGKSSDLQQEQGKQTAGAISGLINTGITGATLGAQGMALRSAMPGAQDGLIAMASEGGSVPGKPEVPGDSPRNDKVHAMLSPGEVVLPRSVAPHPEMAKRFVQHLMSQKRSSSIHPRAVDDMLSALSRHHSMEAA